MKDIYVIYRGNPSYKRVLIRRISSWQSHWRNAKFYIWGPVWNIQLCIVGFRKCNGSMNFRLTNWELEFGW